MTRQLAWLAPVLFAFAAACELKTVSETLPTEPTSVGTAPQPIAQPQAPNPTPTPTPGPDPAPAPAPTPKPTPEPTPPPPSGSCNLAPRDTNLARCTRLSSGEFVDNVEAALDRLTSQQPNLFNFNDTACHNCWKIRNQGSYINAMLKQMDRQGICSNWDGEELQLKTNNQWSEQYDIMTFNGYVRRGPGSYRVTCTPPGF